MKKRIVSLLLCLCLAVGLLPAGALAAPVSYVALGDSITTGYGLGEGEKAFPQLLAEANGLDLTDLAEAGRPADGQGAAASCGRGGHHHRDHWR